MVGFGFLTVRNGVAACLMIAALALLGVDAIGPVHACILGAAVFYGRRRVTAPLPARVWDVLAVAALLVFPIDLFGLSRDLIGSALRLLTFVVIYRCANLSDGRDLRQAVSLSFVQMLAAAASTTDVHFALFLAGYLFMAIWTLMAMASARDPAPVAARRAPGGRPAAVMTTGTVALGGLFFLVIPHFGTGYFQPAAIARASGDGLTGFSDRIELGAISRIKKSRSIVMRVRISGAAEPESLPLRWRGVALDTFDGRSWSVARVERDWIDRGRDGTFPLAPEEPGGRGRLVQEFTIQPLMALVLFAAPGASRIESDDFRSIGLDPLGSIFLASPRFSRFSYTAVSPLPGIPSAGYGPATRDLSGLERARHLSLPRSDPRVEAIARSAIRGADSDFERARKLEDFLRENYAYSLQVHDAGVADPLTHFLVEKNPGHCEYFATALAVMLRQLEIPSRVVNGFAAGEWSGLSDAFVVRQSDAHAWVEAWIRERGWVTFDATPSQEEIVERAGTLARIGRMFDRLELMWDTWIIGLDLLDQQTIVTSLFDAAATVAVTIERGLDRLGDMARGAASFSEVLSAARGPFGGLAALILLAVLLVLRRRRAGGRPGGRRRGPLDDAAALFVKFEARWAARGLRRRPGQTPLEFAREIERRSLERPGEALEFIRRYYLARYGARGGPAAL
ncbi:MAG TPA: DUF3488 and transglutaminase-like domain-containing protein [Candidatus Polarisedimenticolia bacterium]|nr:DUF3488 and transglutaminase-like domain-containing protein [Candidatus Polarisedimenticolia bacterium]